jgi:hypothetical protein
VIQLALITDAAGSNLIAERVFRSREKYGRWRICADLIAGEEKANVPSDLIADEDAAMRSTGGWGSCWYLGSRMEDNSLSDMVIGC